DTAGGTAAESRGRRPLDYIHFLQVKRVAVVAAEIAHAINVKVVTRAESTDGEVVALCAAFARGNADACDVSQRVAKRGGILLRHHLLPYNIHRLRRVAERFRVFAHGCGQSGGRRRDVDCRGYAVEFQHYRTRTSEAPMDASVFQ